MSDAGWRTRRSVYLVGLVAAMGIAAVFTVAMTAADGNLDDAARLSEAFGMLFTAVGILYILLYLLTATPVVELATDALEALGVRR